MLTSCLTCLSDQNLADLSQEEWRSIFDLILHGKGVSDNSKLILEEIKSLNMGRICTECQYTMQCMEKFRKTARQSFNKLIETLNKKSPFISYSGTDVDPLTSEEETIKLEPYEDKDGDEQSIKQEAPSSPSTVSVKSDDIREIKEEVLDNDDESEPFLEDIEMPIETSIVDKNTVDPLLVEPLPVEHVLMKGSPLQEIRVTAIGSAPNDSRLTSVSNKCRYLPVAPAISAKKPTEEVGDLLEAWGLPKLKPVFIKNAINLNSLAALQLDDIKELIPQLGPRALFLSCWKKWHTEYSTRSNQNVSASDLDCNNSSSDINVETKSETQGVSPLDATAAGCPPLTSVPATHTSPTRLTASTISTVPCTSTVAVLPSTSPPKINIVENNLFNILKKNFEARGLLKYVGSALDNEYERNLLASTICKEILRQLNNSPVTSAIYNNWSKQIKEIFPHERITTYYIPPCITAQGITLQARGKLISQLLNIRRKYQKLGVLNIKEKNKNNSADPNSGAPSCSARHRGRRVEKSSNNRNVEEDIKWLKCFSEPWDVVVSKWNATLHKRSKDIRVPKYSIAQYFEEYPALQKPQGYHLLVNDFDHYYPDHANNLFLNFPSVKIKLIELLKKKKSKDKYRDGVMKLADGDTEENKSLAAVLCLTELITPSIVVLPTISETESPAPAKKKRVKDTKWKPSKSESREAFVTHVPDESYLMNVLTQKHKTLIDKGFTPQPYIVAVGDLHSIKSYFVVVNPKVFYNCPNILRSVDTCFKLIWALNLEYSPPCYGPWFFLQKALYKLSRPSDKGSTSVESLMTDCKFST